MSIIEKIYDQSPVFIQNMGINVKGWLIQRRRYNKGFYKELFRYEHGLYDGAKELALFLQSVRDMPQYSQYIDDELLHRVAQGDMKPMQRFPIIDKAYVKANYANFINPNFKGQVFEMRTSGTTGSGLIFPYSVEMENRQWAVWWRYRRGLGVDLDTWCGWFGGKRIIASCNKNKPYWRINHFGRQIMFSAVHLTENTVMDYHAEIKRRELLWLHGYPSNISRLAALMLRCDLPPLNDVKVITTSSENLLKYQIAIIKQAFPNAIVRQHYGLNEGVVAMNEVLEGTWKIEDDFCYVEFIPLSDDTPNVCRIVGTGFSNKAFPLIRYDTGDIVTIESYVDKSTYKLNVDGRSSNVIHQPNGGDICEASLSILMHDFMSVAEAQFHQIAITEIELWIVKGQRYNSEDEKKIYESCKRYFDKCMKLCIKYVDRIPRTSSGKLKLVVSDMDAK